MEAAATSTEIWILGWSALLLFVHVGLQALSSYDLGPGYLLGPRDQQREPRNVFAGRLRRALTNFLETYPAFIAIVVALVVTDRTGGMAATGAWIWLVSRAVFLPVYAAGVPVLRSVVWIASAVGLAMMFIRLVT